MFSQPADYNRNSRVLAWVDNPNEGMTKNLVDRTRHNVNTPTLPDRFDIHCEVPLVDFRELSFYGVAG